MKQFFAMACLAAMLSSCYTSRIYIVRHGERLDQSDDTPLSAAGLQRASALADSLSNKGIDSIFVSRYQRTRQTAAPLAERLSKQLTVYEPRPTQVIVNRLQYLKGKNALVVGHSDTILDIARELGTTPSLPKIESSDYDNMLIVTVKKRPFRKSITLRESVYGVRTLP